MRAYRLATAMTIAALLAGCGGGGQDAAPSSAAPGGPAPIPASSGEAPQASAPAAPAGLVIDVAITGGQVDPANARFDGTVGEPITLRVSSDVTDELHVHSVPDQTFAVAAAPDQSFEFVVEVPGRVEIELHDLGRTVAIVDVRS